MYCTFSINCYTIFDKKAPPPGTLIPSDSVCYISRHWLLLRNGTVNPGLYNQWFIMLVSKIVIAGPLIPFDFACEHGGKEGHNHYFV